MSKIFRIFSNDFHLEDDFKNYKIVYPDIKNILEKLGMAYFSLPVDKFSNDDYKFLEEEIIKTIKKNKDLTGVYLGYDLEAFLIITLFKNLNIPNIYLPSLNSFFQLHHKVYQKQIDPQPTKYSYFNIFSDNIDESLLNYPFYLKPALGDGGLHNYIVRSKDQLNKIIPILRNELPKQEGIYTFFAKKYLDLKKFPLASDHVMICEEFVENFVNLNMDAIVDNFGNIKTLLFSDQIIKENRVLGYSFPSHLPKEILNKAKNLGIEVIKKANLTNSSFNIEFFVMPNNEIKIMEINPRSSLFFNINYNHYDIPYTDLAINLSKGIVLSSPNINYNFISTQLHIYSNKSGKIKDILNLQRVRELSLSDDYQIINYVDVENEKDLYIDNSYHKNGKLLIVVFFRSFSLDERDREISHILNLLLNFNDR